MQIIGMGTAVNVATVVAGSLVGLAIGSRLGERTQRTVTDVLGLVTLVIGALSVRPLLQPTLNQAVGHGAALVVILVSLLLGALVGSGLRLEERIDGFGHWLRRRLGGGQDSRLVEGFVTATLVFCVGPLTILGSLSDGLGRGADQLYVKAVLDGFAAIAFASSLGIGVLASALGVLVIQGSITLLGYLVGNIAPAAQIDALTVTGGIVLLGLGIRLLGLKQVRVADLLPSLVFAPVLLWLAGFVA